MAQASRLMVRYGELDGLADLLARHPRVLPPQSGSLCALEFGFNGYRRSIVVGFRDGCPPGVVELFDNNPMVCATTVCLPSPGATLALLAIDPLSKSGLCANKVRVFSSEPCWPQDVEPFLDALGDRARVESDSLAQIEPGLVAVEVPLEGGASAADIQELYDEFYGRSFLVMRAGSAHPLAAAYSVESREGGPVVRFASRLEGKAGAAQVVQALNVMAGFEDTLAIGG